MQIEVSLKKPIESKQLSRINQEPSGLVSGGNQSQITNIDALPVQSIVNNDQIIPQQTQNSPLFDSSSCPDNYYQVYQNTEKGVESQTQSTSHEEFIDNSIKTIEDFEEKIVKHSTEMVNFEAANIVYGMSFEKIMNYDYDQNEPTDPGSVKAFSRMLLSFISREDRLHPVSSTFKYQLKTFIYVDHI